MPLQTSKFFDGTNIPLNDKKIIKFTGATINSNKISSQSMGANTTEYEVVIPTIPATTNLLNWNQATATLTSTVSGVVASAIISDTSATNRGMVSTGTQTFAGDKTFQNNVTVTGTLQTNGGIKKAIRTVSATGAITINDCIVFITNGATAITLTMPTPVGNTGLGITLVRSIGSTGTITVSPGAGQIEALNGTLGATTSLAALGVYGGSAVFVSNGTNWLRTING
jgi:hypothetical protein